MAAIHVRNVPAPVVAALRERAEWHRQSMQQEIRQILEEAAVERPPGKDIEPLQLTTVRTAATSTWRREEIYGDDTAR